MSDNDKNGKPLNIAVIGCGTVGGATAKLLTGADGEILAGRLGTAVNLKYVIDLDFANAEKLGLDKALFNTDFNVAINDPEVDVIVETVGGTTFAKDLIVQALQAGKHAVTANKALLAHYGPELYAIAHENDVCIAFEASCGGGIPIIQPLTSSLLANRIDALYGIVNGTCNYLLTEMAVKGTSYGDALTQAQADGLAEADPTLDVAGIDSAHKLAVLASLAFGQKVDFEKISCEGIDKIELCDIAWASELGYVMKLLAIAQRAEDGISLRVRPAFISREHPLAWVSGPFNAISVYGHAVGHTMYYGRGAGGFPTASAVVADIAEIALGSAQAKFATLGLWADRTPEANQLPIEKVTSRYYTRVMAEDKPGVFAQIADIFAKYNINIDSVLQRDHVNSSTIRPVIITTHKAIEGDIRNAMKEVEALDSINGKPICLGIVDEHPEFD